ncbi:MAG: type IV pilus biogenesis protein PilM [Candidatus Methylomirabilales bacterium]
MLGAWGLELEKDRMGLCQVRQTSRGVKLKRGVSIPLSAGLLTPSFTEPNVVDEQEFSAQLKSLVEKAGWKGGRIVMTLPDLTCRIGYQDSDEVKGNAGDIRQFLSWRLKDRLPFPVNEARIDFQPLPASNGTGTRLLYLLGREAVLGQYESLVANVGLEPTRIVTRGVALYRCVKIAGMSGKRLLIALGPSSLLLIYAEEAVPRLWRVLPWDDQYTSQERLIRELQETMTYVQEELGAAGPDSLLVIGGEESLAESLTQAGTVPVHTFAVSQHGLSGDLLAATGGALLYQAWRD